MTDFDLIIYVLKNVRFYLPICKWIQASTVCADRHVAGSGLFVASQTLLTNYLGTIATFLGVNGDLEAYQTLHIIGNALIG